MGPGGGPRGIGICHLQGGFLVDFFLSFFFVSELGGFWARALQKFSSGPKPGARAVSTATKYILKKNRHSESVPRTPFLLCKGGHDDGE